MQAWWWLDLRELLACLLEATRLRRNRYNGILHEIKQLDGELPARCLQSKQLAC